MQRVEDTGIYHVNFNDVTSDSDRAPAYTGRYQLDSALIMRDINEYGIASDPHEARGLKMQRLEELAHSRYISTL
jgi:hypothetical protein